MFFALCHTHRWHRQYDHRREDDFTQHGGFLCLFAEGRTLSKVRNPTELPWFPFWNRSRSLDSVPCLFLALGMTYLFAGEHVTNQVRAQDRIEGREPLDWDENDYAVIDE